MLTSVDEMPRHELIVPLAVNFQNFDVEGAQCTAVLQDVAAFSTQFSEVSLCLLLVVSYVTFVRIMVLLVSVHLRSFARSGTALYYCLE